MNASLSILLLAAQKATQAPLACCVRSWVTPRCLRNDMVMLPPCYRIQQPVYMLGCEIQRLRTQDECWWKSVGKGTDSGQNPDCRRVTHPAAHSYPADVMASQIAHKGHQGHHSLSDSPRPPCAVRICTERIIRCEPTLRKTFGPAKQQNCTRSETSTNTHALSAQRLKSCDEELRTRAHTWAMRTRPQNPVRNRNCDNLCYAR